LNNFGGQEEAGLSKLVNAGRTIEEGMTVEVKVKVEAAYSSPWPPISTLEARDPPSTSSEFLDFLLFWRRLPKITSAARFWA
jgi:hypothetical protein